jgi:hypothetical protein
MKNVSYTVTAEMICEHHSCTWEDGEELAASLGGKLVAASYDSSTGISTAVIDVDGPWNGEQFPWMNSEDLCYSIELHFAPG